MGAARFGRALIRRHPAAASLSNLNKSDRALSAPDPPGRTSRRAVRVAVGIRVEDAHRRRGARPTEQDFVLLPLHFAHQRHGRHAQDLVPITRERVDVRHPHRRRELDDPVRHSPPDFHRPRRSTPLFQNLLGLLKRGKDMAMVGMSLIPSYLANLLWIIETTFRGLAQKGYGQNAAVYACLRVLSESVPEPPMLIHFEADDGTLERAPVSHAAQQLIRKPNELQTEFAFWELVTLYLGIVGRCIAWKERDNLGRPI